MAVDAGRDVDSADGWTNATVDTKGRIEGMEGSRRNPS